MFTISKFEQSRVPVTGAAQSNDEGNDQELWTTRLQFETHHDVQNQYKHYIQLKGTVIYTSAAPGYTKEYT